MTDRTPQPGELMAAEIAEQPAAMARLLADTSAFAQVAAQIRAKRPRFVLLTARGTSDHAALYAKYLIETSLGLPVGLVSPSTYTIFGAQPDLADVLWIGVSQSGGSPDLVESTAAARRLGALTLAVTNVSGSPLSEAAELSLDVRSGPELAVAATKTYTSTLLALWLLIDHWRGGDGHSAAVLPDLAQSVLTAPEVLDTVARHRFADMVVTTGRGFSYPTAREAALKLMETSYFSAHAFSGADLLHGPFAMIDEQTSVLAVVGRGAGGRAMAPVLERLDALGAEVTIIGDPAAAGRHAVVPVPAGVSEELAPLLEIIPLQRFAHELAVARNLNPDAPRGLAKVTQTL